jgi:hypothetical protein
MFTLPAKLTERYLTSPIGWIPYVLLRQAAPVTARRVRRIAPAASHERQALFTVSLCAARLGGPLRSRTVLHVCARCDGELRGEHQPLPTQDPQDKMRNSRKYLCNGATTRCAICDGKFGLIATYSWRTAFCSRKCADRFKTRLTATVDGYLDSPPDDGRSGTPAAIFQGSGFRSKELAQ